MIREARNADIPRIVEMGARSLREGPYRDLVGDNPQQTAALAISVIQNQNAKLLVDEQDGELAGLLAFVIFPHYFSQEPTAGEVMWYVEPEKRQSLIAVCLLRAAERLAREMGAVRMQFTAPTAEVGRAYEALGYKPIEVNYQKAL